MKDSKHDVRIYIQDKEYQTLGWVHIEKYIGLIPNVGDFVTLYGRNIVRNFSISSKENILRHDPDIMARVTSRTINMNKGVIDCDFELTVLYEG